MRLTGQNISRSLFQVRSAGSNMRNLPYVTRSVIAMAFSLVSWLSTIPRAFGPHVLRGVVSQAGFGWPAPFSGSVMAFPAAITTSASKPLMGILSPAFTTICLPLATTAM